jgi:hypothetical protein
MKVACSPEWNFPSSATASELAEVVVVGAVVVVVELLAVVVVELVAGAAVVVVVVDGELELLQPAATIATAAMRTAPAAPRWGLRILAIWII